MSSITGAVCDGCNRESRAPLGWIYFVGHNMWINPGAEEGKINRPLTRDRLDFCCVECLVKWLERQRGEF